MILPIGCADFEDIREDQYYYVDKTDLIYKLIKTGKKYFLSRPRRFGKSLLVSTLKYLFEGKKDLFKGLYIEDKWDWSQKYPVVRLSMTGQNHNPEKISKNIIDQIITIAEIAELDVSKIVNESALLALRRLLFRLYKKTGKKAVVLVDEYDAPILDVLVNTELAQKNSNFLREFYRQIKDSEEYIHFVFVTGITMFSKNSIFSGLNNLKNISLVPRYAAICGYTDHDLDTVFSKEIQNLDREEIKLMYKGYGWLGEEKVYNPFCILNALDEQGYEEWWFETATPQYLYEYLVRSNRINLKDVEGCWVDRSQLIAFEVDRAAPQAIFFQSGYLTIVNKKRENRRTKYLLEYPNLEVRNGAYYGLL
ncbi:MAG: AAA family ATPase, partial [Proteobacteria bacterium]|nr:AAA family ATPase [Pseudomonadota bacterium]